MGDSLARVRLSLKQGSDRTKQGDAGTK